MSFQGDVAGIGLGELLQGLSRGGRDGVLTLYGDELSAALGLHRGQVYLLAGPDEDEDTWVERSMAAYPDEQDPKLESSRRERIARSSRLETMYQMLEAPNLHFRFEPGPIPVPPGYRSHVQGAIALQGEGATPAFDPQNSPWGPGFTVEYLLLEHARISDEASSGAAATLSAYDLPRSYDTRGLDDLNTRDFLEHCDGSSTLLEIADRLGWPLLQCKNVVGQHVEAGNLRIAQPRELLAAAQRELEQGRIGRAAFRLSGWVQAAPPGPPDIGDADLLLGEWEKGRIAHILFRIRPRVARALLRKLDSVDQDTRASRDRWRALKESHKGDEVAVLHEVALRLVSSDEPDARTFHELLRLARSFQERELPRRTRTVLRLAAGHLPEKPKIRIELGKRMIETGLTEEGTRWLLHTAKQLISTDNPENALVPIQHVLRDSPDNAEALALEEKTRTAMVNRKRRRMTVGVGASVAVLLSMVALVQYRSHRRVQHWLDEIQTYVGRPGEAVQALEETFGQEPPPRIAEALARLRALHREAQKEALEEWRKGYVAAEEACRFGDPLLGLRRTLELEAPPGTVVTLGSFPERQDLLGILAARLNERSEELDLPATAPLDELKQEQVLLDLLSELLMEIDPDSAPPDVVSFHFRTSELQGEILARREERALDRERISAQERTEQSNILLATARAHDTAGDLERALSAYDRLLETDQELQGLAPIRNEIDDVRRHYEGLQTALELAEDGEHEAAIAELLETCPQPIEHLLPFRVESRPTGVRVSLPDGRVRTTPFTAKSGVGEDLGMRFSAPGYEERSIQVDRPQDMLVELHKVPERSWRSTYRIEAVPVPAGDDHIVADRYGNVLRLGEDSEVRWQLDLRTLGGVARTPVFLPGRPGHLLIVSEDGKAWLIDGSNGHPKGPLDLGAPPVDGPVLTRSGVTAAFADQRIAVWEDRLEPTYFQDDGLFQGDGKRSESTSANMVILRRSISEGTSLESPWNEWTIEVRPESFLIRTPDGRGFTAAREGDWEFVAWEAPKAFVPHGRVWVSDEAGLRSYLPSLEELVSFEER